MTLCARGRYALSRGVRPFSVHLSLTSLRVVRAPSPSSVKMSRTLRKAVESAKQKKETEINLPDEGIAHLEEVPELC